MQVLKQRWTALRAFLLAAILAICPEVAAAQQIVAGHDAVARYSGIPQQYVDSVKTWWVSVPGESHSSGYRKGLALRFSGATWGDVNSANGWRYSYGEEDWYTSQTAIGRTADGITYCNTHGRTVNAIGFGWCWDMTWQNGPGGTEDPVHQVRWAGSSAVGPQGNLIWGLDAGDSALTGNSVCMDTYLAATQSYADSCAAKGWPTTVFYTTGPVDGNDNNENGYQREIKHQYLRQYVQLDSTRVLFDYADILCWSDAGSQHVATWNDGGTPRYYPQIHADNMLDTNGSYVEDGDHIGQRSAIRLAKAMWWMLARLAGWDGTPAGVAAGGPLASDPDIQLSVRPNPFRHRASISYTVARAGDVDLAVYNAIGQKVRALVNSRQGPGTHTVAFEAESCPNGVYFCRLWAGNGVSTARIVLLR